MFEIINTLLNFALDQVQNVGRYGFYSISIRFLRCFPPRRHDQDCVTQESIVMALGYFFNTSSMSSEFLKCDGWTIVG